LTDKTITGKKGLCFIAHLVNLQPDKKLWVFSVFGKNKVFTPLDFFSHFVVLEPEFKMD
jgi:hypothetical protein